MANTYIQTMPLVMATIQALTTSDEPRAIQCFELLDELCENVNFVIGPHVKSLVNMCLAIATNKSLDEALRIKAVGFIGWLARTKKKALVKNKLVEPIVGETLFTVIWMNTYCFIDVCTNRKKLCYLISRYVIWTHDYKAR